MHLEILFHNKIQTGDIHIIKDASTEKPGEVQLKLASILDPRPEAPNSLPVISGNGGDIFGFAQISPPIFPFQDTYVILSMNTTSTGSNPYPVPSGTLYLSSKQKP